MEPLSGEELLKKVKELENLSKEQRLKPAATTRLPKRGRRVNMMKFLNALIDAEGIQLDSTPHAAWGRSAIELVCNRTVTY